MNYLLLEEFAAKCEQLAEEKETEREWLSDFADMVLEEAAKVCEAQIDLEYATGKVDHNEMAWCMKLAIDIRGMKAPNAGIHRAAEGRPVE